METSIYGYGFLEAEDLEEEENEAEVDGNVVEESPDKEEELTV